MDRSTLDTRLHQAAEHYAQGRYDEAVAIYQAALEQDPANPDALNDAGLCHYQLDAPQEAIACFEQALEHDPSYEGAFFNLLEVTLQNDDLGQAIEQFDIHGAFIPNSSKKERLSRQLKKTAFRIGHDDEASKIDSGIVQPSKNSFPTSLQRLKIRVVSAADHVTDHKQRRYWGDHWFQQHFEQALMESGATVTSDAPDVIVHLFGAPMSRIPNVAHKILWIHSHPDWISPRLLARYDRIYCISQSFTEKIRSWGYEADFLPGATAFSLLRGTSFKTPDIVFVGNAKSQVNGRQVIRDLQQTTHQAAIWGKGWKGHVPDNWIQGTYYPNKHLRGLYGSAKVVLNDHHLDMRLEGFAGNRIFDAVASGAHVVSDSIRDLPKPLEPFVSTYKRPEDLQEILDGLLESGRTSDPLDRSRILKRYSFSTVANRILQSLHTEIWDTPPTSSNGTARSAFSGVSVQKRKALTVNEPTAYVIMGMHRSGTSLVTHLLHRSGIFAGSTLDHIPPASDNPEGFWELGELVKLNKVLLYLAGGDWATPPSAESLESIPPPPRTSSVFEYFDGVQNWAIKDPRLCLTFPVIEPALPKKVKIIRVYRPAEAIAKSLAKRNGIHSRRGCQLAQLYFKRMEKYTGQHECFDVDFESLFSTERDSLLKRLGAFISTDRSLIDLFTEIVRPELKHY